MRDVAALCAMIITKHEAATGTSARISLQVTSGNPIEGSPPGTGPMTAMPRSAKWNAALAIIVPYYREQRKRQSRGNAIADQDAACHQRGQRQRREIDPR